ncbi:cytokinin dehydrogenase 9-like [Zingiber officinale]|uniref:cytokinin dehydrogenase 9-like n=1 Tax=Zingiber officinale TaxID=94328 RepID=UPI001C4C0127|nr:cytokinin dehydrogenase 9-like [Zingiber officinale]
MTSFPFVPKDPAGAEQFVSDGKVLYCLEVAKYFDPEKNINSVNEEVEALLSKLSYIPSTRLETEVPYTVFLERVHMAELKRRAMNIREVPHPWLNLLVPGSGIQDFGNGVFGKIITSTEDVTLTVYPVNKSKWDDRTSAVFPDEDVFYLVGLLSGALDDESLKVATERNARIVEFCEKEGIDIDTAHVCGISEMMWL